MCSYMYYYCNKNLVSDSEYDNWCLDLRSNFDKCNHKLKELIDTDTFKESTSLYYIREHEYPNGLKHIAWDWYNLLYPDEVRPVIIEKQKKSKKRGKKK